LSKWIMICVRCKERPFFLLVPFNLCVSQLFPYPSFLSRLLGLHWKFIKIVITSMVWAASLVLHHGLLMGHTIYL
jgi:hypothetical protein